MHVCRYMRASVCVYVCTSISSSSCTSLFQMFLHVWFMHVQAMSSMPWMNRSVSCRYACMAVYLHWISTFPDFLDLFLDVRYVKRTSQWTRQKPQLFMQGAVTRYLTLGANSLLTCFVLLACHQLHVRNAPSRQVTSDFSTPARSVLMHCIAFWCTGTADFSLAEE
jgi:hypothetical protein